METTVKTTATPDFKVWRTVTLGALSVKEINIALERNGILNFADDILSSENFKISKKKVEIDLFKEPLYRLFGSYQSKKGDILGEEEVKKVSYPMIIEQAEKFGLQICLDEAGVLARLVTTEKDTYDGYFYVAINPYRDCRNGKDYIFRIATSWLKEGTKETLSTREVSKNYPSGCVFVFSRYKK